MHLQELISGNKWKSQFNFYVTVPVMAALCLVLIPDGAFDAVNGSGFFTGD